MNHDLPVIFANSALIMDTPLHLVLRLSICDNYIL